MVSYQMNKHTIEEDLEGYKGETWEIPGKH